MKPSNPVAGLGRLTLLAGLAAFQTANAAIPAVGAKFYLSGASAAREIPPAIAAEFCDSGVNDLARYNSPAGNTLDYGITICTYKNVAPVPTSLRGVKVAVFTRAAGGSLFGVRPIASPQKIKFIDGSTCPTDDGNPATIQTCSDPTGNDYDSGNASAWIPDVGISDEDPKFVCNVAKEVGPVQCTAAELAGIANTGKFKQFATYQVIWTLQVGNKFGDTTLGTQAITSITPQVATAIMTGTYVSLGQVKRALGLPTIAADDTRGLKVCRRTNTSGTQAGHTQLWAGANFCGSTDSYGFVSEASDDDNAGNGYPLDYDVVENSSSGTLTTCLNPTTPFVGADADRVIGINSLENAPPANAVEIQINGVAPSQQAAAQGTYPWYHESTAQWNTDTLNAVAGVTAIDPTVATRSTLTQRTDFYALYRDSLKSPARLKAANLNGVLAIPGGSNVPDLVWNSNNPVGWTKKNGANCRNPQPVFPNP